MAGIFLLFTACKNDDGAGMVNLEYEGGEVSVKIEEGTGISLFTDKACYAPGETVSFGILGDIPSNAKIRYRHLDEVIEEQPLAGSSWTWTLPTVDFTGYMVDIYASSDDKEVIYGTIAVDASSDWKRFPRYGFVAEFGQKSDEDIKDEMSYLSRCHINGVQFQDWHNKHHWPLGSTRDGQIMPVYKDIANRDVYTETVEKYIEVQHALGMKSIFYNLCFGALDDANLDGVQDSWGLFKDYKAKTRDCHELPDSWKSNIYLTDPGNKAWQDYLIQRNTDVYNHFAFDGYQIDQLGNRGTVFNVYGKEVDLPQGYASFIKAMKQAHPDKRLIMNAVSRYGAEQIAQTGKVDFLYNEVWGKDNDRTEAKFSHLKTIIDENNEYSGNQLNTVFAAYMNYWLAENVGEFNTPGVLLTDAVMFALGGSHLELGPHMLCKEYFPNDNLKMTEALKKDIIHYYDFMTAYQNVLRDGCKSLYFFMHIKQTGQIINPYFYKLILITSHMRKHDTLFHALHSAHQSDTVPPEISGIPGKCISTAHTVTHFCCRKQHGLIHGKLYRNFFPFFRHGKRNPDICRDMSAINQQIQTCKQH